MISFSNLGKHGRFGNQLFQYAFLRTSAQRLGAKFHCPQWLGDKIFNLNDQNERVWVETNMSNTYHELRKDSDFDESSLHIEDQTEILGFFQSEKYLDREKVFKWYAFKEEMISSVREKYKHIDFSNSVGIHLRFGDIKRQLKYVNLSKFYYNKALSYINHRENILVFSDEIVTAKECLGDMGRNFIYIEDNTDYEDFYLMTLCHDFICSVSTFSWWGAWLNSYPDKTVVAPKEWIRPGSPIRNTDLCCRDWVILKTCRPIIDDYRFLNAIKTWKERLKKTKVRISGKLNKLKEFCKN